MSREELSQSWQAVEEPGTRELPGALIAAAAVARSGKSAPCHLSFGAPSRSTLPQGASARLSLLFSCCDEGAVVGRARPARPGDGCGISPRPDRGRCRDPASVCTLPALHQLPEHQVAPKQAAGSPLPRRGLVRLGDPHSTLKTGKNHPQPPPPPPTTTKLEGVFPQTLFLHPTRASVSSFVNQEAWLFNLNALLQCAPGVGTFNTRPPHPHTPSAHSSPVGTAA